MLFNGKYKAIQNHDEIESQLCMKSIKNVMKFDTYSKNEIKESLNSIENMTTRFSLWLNDLEEKLKDAVTSRTKEIKLDRLDLSRDNNSNHFLWNFPLNKIFTNFEKLKIEGEEIEIEEEIEKYLRENKRTGNKRRKNFSLEDEGKFIKKKPKENIGRFIERNENIVCKDNNNKISEENFVMKEIEEESNQTYTNNPKKSSVGNVRENSLTINNPENISIEKNSEIKANAYYNNYNNNLDLNEVIEEMPSKEEDNFKFSLSYIADKKDSNVEMKEDEGNSDNKLDHINFDKEIQNQPSTEEPVLNFNLKCLSAVKSNEEKCSESISSLNNFNINEILANFHDSNLNLSEEKMKDIKKDNKKEREDNKNISFSKTNLNEILYDNNNNAYEKIIEAEKIDDKLIEVVDVITYQANSISNKHEENKTLKPDCVKIAKQANDAVISNINETNGSKDKKLIIKSSNIKLITSLNSKTSKSNVDYNLNCNSDTYNPVLFTFFKEKPQNQSNIVKDENTSDKNVTVSFKQAYQSGINNISSNFTNNNNPASCPSKDTKEPIIITGSNTINNNNLNNNITSNFLKDKEDLFKILFNYNDSYSNLDDSPAVEKWDPTKVESGKKKVVNLKNNLNQYQNPIQSDSNKKIKLGTNKFFKEHQESHENKIESLNKDNNLTNGNFFKSSKTSKHIITSNNNNNNLGNSQKNLTINNLSKSKLFKTNSPTYDAGKIKSIKNNITKTLSKKILDPGYEISDNSASSSDDKNESDSDVFSTPMFKNMKIPKFIPKWANDKKYLNERVIYQKNNMDHKAIFGSCKVDDLNLNLIFTNSKKEYNQPRGDSADWKLDNTISSSYCEDKNIDEAIYNMNNNNFSNYNYYNMNYPWNNKKIQEGPNRKLLDVFNQHEI